MNRIALSVCLSLSAGCTTGEKIDPQLVLPYTFELEELKAEVTPYVAVFSKGSKRVYYVASKHISQKEYPDLLEHPTLKTVERVFKELKPQAVVIEGVNTGSKLSPKSLHGYADKCKTSNYTRCGESFFAINHARASGASYVSGEPLDARIHEEILAAGYKTEDLLGFYLVRQIPQLKRQKNFSRENFPKQAQGLLDRFKRKMKVKSDFNYTAFTTWYAKNMSRPKSFLDIENNDPAPHGGDDATYVQRISNMVTLIRDRVTVARIQAMLETNDRVLVLYGGSHLITQMPALEVGLGKPKYEKMF